MKKKNLISVLSIAVLMAVLFSSSVFAQDNQTKVKTKGFVDANQDGYNDLAPDVDGDGIPNGRDEDYTGSKVRKNGKGFIDLNGDGINDNAFDSDGDGIPNGQDPDFVRPQDGSGQKKMNGKHSNVGGNKYGPGNGSGNNGVGPKDGTGYGSGNGTGTCDGTGSKGRGGRR